MAQWGFIGTLAVAALQRVDMDNPETARRCEEQGITRQEFDEKKRGLARWLLATITLRLLICISALWLLSWQRMAYYALALTTPLIFLVNLYGGDSFVQASFDVMAFAAVSATLFTGTPQP